MKCTCLSRPEGVDEKAASKVDVGANDGRVLLDDRVGAEGAKVGAEGPALHVGGEERAELEGVPLKGDDGRLVISEQEGKRKRKDKREGGNVPERGDGALRVGAKVPELDQLIGGGRAEQTALGIGDQGLGGVRRGGRGEDERTRMVLAWALAVVKSRSPVSTL